MNGSEKGRPIVADLPFERELADALRVVNVAVQSALDALGAMDEAALVVSLANLETAVRAVQRRAKRVLPGHRAAAVTGTPAKQGYSLRADLVARRQRCWRCEIFILPGDPCPCEFCDECGLDPIYLNEFAAAYLTRDEPGG